VSLTFDDVWFAFLPARGPEILRGVSGQAARGALTAVVGPNGAGKSTLLRLGLGLLKPQKGRVLLDGNDMATLPAGERARRAAYVPQRGAAALGLTCRDVVRLGRYACRERGRAELLDRVLQEAELTALGDKTFDTLSAGQKQRAILARAFYQLAGREAAGCSLFADEPVSAMDPRHAERALAALSAFALEGACVLVVLHDLTMALRHAGWVILLGADGRVLAQGPPAETLTPQTLGPLYGAEFEVIEQAGRAVALHPKRATPTEIAGGG
jgi:iron complex transport system ATP-binding protein